MARDRDGWEYTEDGPRWAPTTSVALAGMTHDLYGHDLQEKEAELMDLVRAVQRDAAQKLSEAGHEEAARLIFPYYPEESDDE
ncbi:hypothetical protein [Streptomyces sp. NPDC055709]